MESTFMTDYRRDLLMNECSNYVPFALLLDHSGSTGKMLLSGKTRFQTAVDELEASLQKLMANDSLAENVHLFLYLFGGDKVECIVEGKALCDIDLPQLCQTLRTITPSGKTPMGRCIEEALDKLEEAKRVVSRAALNYSQPILTIISDGLPTDEITGAKQRIQQALAQEQQKLLFLPVGIGDPGTRFPIFETLLENDKLETPVVTNAEGLREYFRLLNKTIRAIERGQYVTPSNQFGLVRTIAEQAAQATRNELAARGGEQ